MNGLVGGRAPTHKPAVEVGASQEPLGTPEAKFAARRLSLLLFLACLAPACLALLGFAVVGGSPPALLSIGVAAGCIAVALLLISGMIRAAEAARRGRAEAALTESEKRLRLAQDAAGVGVWEIDLANGGTHQSPQSARLFDLDPRADGIYGSADFADRVGNDQLEALLAAIAAAGEARGPLDTTLRLVRRDGAVRWIRLHGDYDRAEDRPRLLGLAIDVTREHETQAQIRDAHDKLLRVARLSAMGAMASTIAHELNQPLSAIASYMEACGNLTRRREGPPDTMMLDLIERTRVQALRAGDIIRRVRGFTIRGEISRAPTDIEAVLRAACASVREHPVGAGVTIECHFDVRARRAPVDALQLEQVVANLVRNAAEATQGSAVRRVAVATTLAADAILVRVTDSGRGLDDAMLHNLFEPFRTTKETGTGLGLPICRTIVEAHGGRLWAERAAGGGAQFCFTLPLAAAAAEEGYHGD